MSPSRNAIVKFGKPKLRCACTEFIPPHQFLARPLLSSSLVPAIRRRPVAPQILPVRIEAMSTNQTSSASAKGRAERPERIERAPKRSLRDLMQNMIARVRLWLDKLVSLPSARVAMIFVAGFVAGIVWDSYSSPARKAVAGWSPYLSWMAPTPSSERFKSMELALSTARQNLSKLASEMNRLEAQGLDAPPQRRSGR
jgi:hypothetical protein